MTVVTLFTADCATAPCCALLQITADHLLITAQYCALTADCCAGTALAAESSVWTRYLCLMASFLSDVGDFW